MTTQKIGPSAGKHSTPDHTVNITQYAAIPQAMRDAPRWLVWRAVSNSDPAKKPRKIPHYVDGAPRSGELDTSADTARLGTFNAALAALQTGSYAGLGFALGDGWQGVDLDGISGRIELCPLLGELPGYIEASPSGDGFHAIGYGRPFNSLGSNGTGIEAYSAGRYFTVTGNGKSGQQLTCIAQFVERRLCPMHGAKSASASPVEHADETISAETFSDLQSALRFIPADDRQTWVRIGLALKSLGGIGHALFVQWSATSEKHDPIADAATWDTFKPTRTGYAAIFAEAQRNGWGNPRRGVQVDTASIGFGGELPPGARPIVASTFQTPSAISAGEWSAARSTPDCIVDQFLFADVAVFIAPGGMGKTTLKLFEAVRIALGLPLYGLTVCTPGTVIFITAEDSRNMLIARLRLICAAMLLSQTQIATVMERVRIADVSGNGFKLTAVVGDVVRPAAGVDEIIAACAALKPVLIVIDPAVSFGIGESRVNDAEQGLVEAARRLRSAFKCCVQYIHHSGKQNAREKAIDQYSGRGGSAFADGARMVHVLQSLTPDEWRNETGAELEPGETGLRLARPKMSYCAPVGDIFIRRKGYRFDHVPPASNSKQAQLDANANRVWQLLASELAAGRYPSKNTLESLDTGLSRSDIRAGVDWLIASRRVESRPIPNAGKGGKRECLHPVGEPTANQPKNASNSDEQAGGEFSIIASPPP